MIRQWIISSKDHQSRIDDFAYYQHINKTILKKIKMTGDILVNGEHQTVRYLLNEGDVLTLIFPQEKNHINPEPMPIHIVYEDDYVLVIDKPKGMPCIPTRSYPSGTLANALSFYYQHIGLDSTVHLVSRLDKETSGLMIVAKYGIIHDMMCKDMKSIYRKYHAHVEGDAPLEGLVDLPIYRNGYHIKREIHDMGKQSKTYFKRLGYYQDMSLIECVLETGRTHQIRVHMAAIGHPLIGDSLYGGREGHFDLESVMVAFVHPVTRQVKSIRKGLT